MQILAHDQYSGELTVVDNAGVSPAGGLSIVTEGGRTRLVALARMMVEAATDAKPVADAAIDAATATYSVQTTYPLVDFGPPKQTTVRCGQVLSAEGEPAGCDQLDVTLPEGSDAQPVSLTALSGTGTLRAVLDGRLRNVSLHARSGPIDVSLVTTPGAALEVVSETGQDVTVRLRPTFAADLVTIETGGAIDTAAFPDVVVGKPRGAPGAGARSLVIRSVGGGRVTLAAR
ncbi:MAG: hypothetical protein JWP97_3619 [Labilithrix sp.]|nr:hypothetical protein [Labilithrix sp.]